MTSKDPDSSGRLYSADVIEGICEDYEIPRDRMSDLWAELEAAASVYIELSSSTESTPPHEIRQDLTDLAKVSAGLADQLVSLRPATADQLDGGIDLRHVRATSLASMDRPETPLTIPIGGSSVDFVLVDRADLAGILGDLASVASETASNIDEGKTGPGRVLALSRWVMMIAEAWRSYSGKAFTFNATNSGEPLSPAAVFASTLAAKLPSPPRQSRVNNEMKKHIKKHRAFHRKNSDQSQE